MKVCLLVVHFRQDNVLEGSDDATRKRLPEENAGTSGKHGGSTARHAAHESAQHKFGTCAEYIDVPRHGSACRALREGMGDILVALSDTLADQRF